MEIIKYSQFQKRYNRSITLKDGLYFGGVNHIEDLGITVQMVWGINVTPTSAKRLREVHILILKDNELDLTQAQINEKIRKMYTVNNGKLEVK